MKLTGKTALVTGAGRGLGLEIAHGLAGNGAHVVLHGRKPAELDEAMHALAADGASVSTLVADLADEASTAAACRKLVEQRGNVDILVNNAGVRDRRPLDQLDRAALRALLEVNLVAPFDLVRRLAPHMPDGGRIVNITSIAGPIARAGDPGYIATKGGLDALTRALAAELGHRAITVNAVAPGFFATEANSALVGSRHRRTLVAPHLARTLGRAEGAGRCGRVPVLAGSVVHHRCDAAGRWRLSRAFLENFRNSSNREISTSPCFVEFSSRNPVSASLENALAGSALAGRLAYIHERCRAPI